MGEPYRVQPLLDARAIDRGFRASTPGYAWD